MCVWGCVEQSRPFSDMKLNVNDFRKRNIQGQPRESSDEMKAMFKYCKDFIQKRISAATSKTYKDAKKMYRAFTWHTINSSLVSSTIQGLMSAMNYLSAEPGLSLDHSWYNPNHPPNKRMIPRTMYQIRENNVLLQQKFLGACKKPPPECIYCCIIN